MIPDKLAALFKDCTIATAKDTAAALDMDPKVLRDITRDGLIRAVRKGNLPGYTLAACMAYLDESTPWASTDRRKAPTGTTTSPSKAKGFTARRGARAGAMLKLVSGV